MDVKVADKVDVEIEDKVDVEVEDDWNFEVEDKVDVEVEDKVDVEAKDKVDVEVEDKVDVEVEDKVDVSLGDDVDENICVSEKRLKPARDAIIKENPVKSGFLQTFRGKWKSFYTFKMVKLKDILVFFVINVALNSADIVSDGWTAWDLWAIHPTWACLTLLWMFAPFLLHFLVIFLDKQRDFKGGLKKAFIHFPLVIPVTNTYHIYKLAEIKYEDPMPGISLTKIEELRMKAGKLSLTEAFMESGPQLILQLHIVSCTGNIGETTQCISIVISFVSLLAAACRAFFIQRDPARADPEPTLHMMLRVIPSMLLVLVYNILSWTIMAGILKGWTFLVLFVIFTTCYLAHKGWDHMKGKGNKKFPQDDVEAGTHEMLVPTEMVEKDERSIENENQKKVKRNFFSIKAAVLAIFLPCVIGRTSYTFLLISLTSYSVRTLAFLLSLILAYYNTIPAGTFLFHCVPQLPGSPLAAQQNMTPCFSLSDCFGNLEGWSGQKVRICGEDDHDTIYILGFGVFLLGIFSLVGTVYLHKIGDYEYLFNVSKKYCWFFDFPLPCCLKGFLSPIIHRSTIHTLLDKYPDSEASSKLEDIFTVASNNNENLVNLASRPLPSGQTALISSVDKDKIKSATVLLAKGAIIEENSVGKHPFNIAVQKKNHDMVKVILAKGAKIQENTSGEHPLNIAVMNKDLEMAKILTDNGVKIQKYTSGKLITGEHLNIAVDNKDDEMTEYLVKNMKKTEFGVVHTIVDQDILLKLVELKDSSNAQLNSLLHAGISKIPLDNISPGHQSISQDLVQKWNEANTEEMQVELGERQIFTSRVSSISSYFTSDNKISHGGDKPITEVEIRCTDNGYIHTVMCKYDAAWGEEHITGYTVYSEMEEDRKILTLGRDENIIRVYTRYSSAGYLVSLQVETSLGRKWGHDTRYEDKKANFSLTGRRLAFLSSAPAEAKYYQTIFHWI